MLTLHLPERFQVKLLQPSHVRNSFFSGDVEKKFMPLCREAHVEVTMLETHQI